LFKFKIERKIGMAVNNNPYESWQRLRQNSDYRSTDTQINSLVRQQLSQEEYLRSSNRVNSGPRQITRANMAKNTPQSPHVLAPEDMWGWQNWANKPSSAESPLATGLREENTTTDIPGASYPPGYNVGGMAGGCNSCRRRRY
jgi:hypothetical protein